jgi:putative oxidoreductase
MSAPSLHSYDTAMVILRVGFGLMMAAHGLNHWKGGGKIAGTGRWFSSLGLKHGELQAWMSVVTEIGAGIGLAIGFLTPLMAGALASTMLVAIFLVHRHNGFWILKEGWEYTTLVALSCLAIATLGAGEWSIDNGINLDQHLGFATDGFNGFWIALVAGVGGAAGLIIAFWRPQAKSS